MVDRCNLGDIAIIIHDNPGCEANIGRMVLVGGPRKVFPLRGTVWRITPVVGNTMTYVDYNKSVAVGLATDIEHEDNWLLPICPESDGEHIENNVVSPIDQELESV